MKSNNFFAFLSWFLTLTADGDRETGSPSIIIQFLFCINILLCIALFIVFFFVTRGGVVGRQRVEIYFWTSPSSNISILYVYIEVGYCEFII